MTLAVKMTLNLIQTHKSLFTTLGILIITCNHLPVIFLSCKLQNYEEFEDDRIRKHRGKRRNCSLRAFSLFVSMLSHLLFFKIFIHIDYLYSTMMFFSELFNTNLLAEGYSALISTNPEFGRHFFVSLCLNYSRTSLAVLFFNHDFRDMLDSVVLFC